MMTTPMTMTTPLRVRVMIAQGSSPTRFDHAPMKTALTPPMPKMMRPRDAVAMTLDCLSGTSFFVSFWSLLDLDELVVFDEGGLEAKLEVSILT